jgi:hypothetical protein
VPPRLVQREWTSNFHSSSGEWPSTNPIRAHRKKTGRRSQDFNDALACYLFFNPLPRTIHVANMRPT